jgi:hypothetical protein
MKARNDGTQNNNLSGIQSKTFKQFRRKLNEMVPDYRITWVHPYNETIIEVGLEPQKKWTYRKSIQAAKLAIEVGDEAGVTIILR